MPLLVPPTRVPKQEGKRREKKVTPPPLFELQSHFPTNTPRPQRSAEHCIAHIGDAPVAVPSVTSIYIPAMSI